MISSGINLVMTVIGFCVSTMFIVFVCTRLICARIHLNASRRPFPAASRSDLGILERWVHGLEPIVVANFPTKKFSDPCFSSTDDVQCTICLVEYHVEDVLRILPPCGHSFHATCIDIWLHQHSTCPVCRVSLRECPPERKQQQQHVMMMMMMPPMYSSSTVRSHYDDMLLQFEYRDDDDDASSGHCLSTGRRHALPSTAHNNNNNNNNNHHALLVSSNDEEEDQLHSGAAQVVGESISVAIEECGNNHMAKTSGNKHVESPSNP